MTRSRLARMPLVLVTVLIALALHIPILVPMVLSFFPRVRGKIQWDQPGLDAYSALMNDGNMLTALGNTVIVGIATITLSLTLGLLLSLHRVYGRPFGARALQVTIFLPFVLPPIMTGIALLLLFRELSIERSLVTVTIGHTVLVLAVVYRLLGDRLSSLGSSIIEASFDLGASGWQTFHHVILPNLYGTMFSAGLLAFALSFDETMLTILLTGTDKTLPMHLWAMMRLGFTPSVNALVALVMITTTGLCFFLVSRLMPKASAG